VIHSFISIEGRNFKAARKERIFSFKSDYKFSLGTIGAWDIPKHRSFYLKLGWIETDCSSDNYSVFKTAGGMLSIWSIHEMTKDKYS